MLGLPPAIEGPLVLLFRALPLSHSVRRMPVKPTP